MVRIWVYYLGLIAMLVLWQQPELSWAFVNGRGAYCATQMALATQSCSLATPRARPFGVSTVNRMRPLAGPSTDTDEDEDEGTTESQSRVRHRRHHHGEESSVFEECCRWLHQLDTICICDSLVHLPPVLSQLNHAYVLEVGESCEVKFECDGNFL